MSWTFGDLWPYLIAAIGLVASVVATIHVLLHKREPRAAIGWVALIWLSPLIGCALYFCFGINRITRRAVSLGLQDRWRHPRDVRLAEADVAQQQEFAAQHPTHADLAILVGRLTGRAAVPGNSVKALLNGDQAYPAMLEAIDGAERSITLLSYIFDNDRAGQAFLERLVAASRRGVEVRILIDGVGSRYSRPSMIGQLRAAGLRAEAFLPTRVPRLFHYANLRNHRKILVVDGRIGFTGGTNIREGHWLSLAPASPVRCLHFRFEGPVVSHLQEVFALDWAFATGESLGGETWFAPMARAGDIWARGISDGPDEDLDKMPLTILGALAAARRTVHIVTPYFLPEQSIIQALNAAALRGINVHALLPSENNVPLVHWACHAVLPHLLERGCRVYLSPPPFDHTKLLLVDGIWSLVGSTNWDARSLRLNFEFNVECYSLKLGAELESIVTSRIDASRELTLEEFHRRKMALRLRDGFARLLSPYL